MSHVKNILFIWIACILTSAGWPLPSRAEAPRYTIKLATIAPNESIWADFLNKVKMYIESRSRGRAKVIWYMSGVQGDEPEVIEKIRSGEIHGGVITIVGLGIIHSSIEVTLLPFLLQNYEEVDLILDMLYPEFQRNFQKEGFELMGFTEVGFPRFFSKKPLASMEDFRKLRVWTWEGMDIARDALASIGFQNIVPLSLYGVKEALTEDRIDVVYSPCYAILGLQWYQYTGYMTDFTMGYTPGAIVMNRDFYHRLPQDIQYLVQQAFDFVFKPLRQIIRKEEENACRGFERRGIKRIKASPELMAELEKRSQKIYNQYADRSYSPALLQKVVNKLEKYRSR